MFASRATIGRALIIAGALLVTSAGARYVQGAMAQDGARREWDAMRAHAEVDSAWSRGTRVPAAAIANGAPVARLLIPKIGLDAIVLEGVDADALNGGPGHLPGSPLPGGLGNSIISAHRDRHFRHFDELRVGDTLRTESSAGETRWVIVSRRVIDRDAPALFRARTPTLTLTTCWPIEYLGPAPDRLILSAKPLDRPTG